MTSANHLLHIDERDIRRHGPGNLLAVCWRQWRTERALAKRGVVFRTEDPAAVEAAYSAMTAREFEDINGRQDWANWRTIPRALSGKLEDRPLRVLDLGCGSGGSTRVLAFYCPGGSRLTGYELSAPLVEIARRGVYPQRHGKSANVSFGCQGVTETLRESDGSAVAAASVDAVNASGIVGHHLNADSFALLRDELRRVIRPGGLALLDVGPTLGEPELIRLLTGFRFLGRWKSWLLDPTGQAVFQLGS